MKYSAVLSMLILFACGSNSHEVRTTLLDEQKTLKDSLNHIYDRIGSYERKGAYDSAEAQKKQIGAIHVRLTAIQSSLDSLVKMK